MKAKPLLPWFYLAIGLSQAVHSIEEQLTGFYEFFPRTTGVLHDRIGFIPVYELGADGFAVANMAIITVLLFFAPFVFLHRRWALKVGLIVAVIELTNGLYHLSLTAYLGRYFSGSFAALGLLVFSLLYLLGRPLAKEGLT